MIVLALLFGGKTASVFSGDSPLKNAEVAAANLLLMLGFVLVKALALIITSKASDTPKRPRALMERYYFYDAGTGRWYLKSRWLNFRQLVLGCVVAGVIVSGVILGLVWALGAERGTWLYVFPCAAQIVLNEISNFLGGQTRDEQQTTIRADASCSSRISVFSRVQGALTYLFPAQLLSSHMGCEFMRSEGVTNVLKTLSESEDRIDRITAAHFALREASVLNPGRGARHHGADAPQERAVFHALLPGRGRLCRAPARGYAHLRQEMPHHHLPRLSVWRYEGVDHGTAG